MHSVFRRRVSQDLENVFDTNLYDPTLDIRTVGQLIGHIPAREQGSPSIGWTAGQARFKVQKNHKFVCKNSFGYVRIIEIKNTKEVVKI